MRRLDDEIAIDARYIEEQHVVARFLANQLSAMEQRAFEVYFQEHPEIMAEMEATAMLKLGWRALAKEGRHSAIDRWTPWRQRSRRLAVIACAVLLILAFSFALTRAPADLQPLAASLAGLLDERGAVLPLTATHAIVRSRSVQRALDLELPRTAGAIELRVVLDSYDAAQRYRVNLASLDPNMNPGAGLTTIEGLQASADDGAVAIFVRSSLLAPGFYRLTIAAQSGAAAQPNVFVLRALAPK